MTGQPPIIFFVAVRPFPNGLELDSRKSMKGTGGRERGVVQRRPRSVAILFPVTLYVGPILASASRFLGYLLALRSSKLKGAQARRGR